MSLARTAFRSVTAGPSTLRYVTPRITTLNPLLAQSFRLATASQPLGGQISHRYRWNSSQAGNKADDDSLRIEAPTLGSKSQPIGRIEPRLSITMTCTANDCGHRSTHEFTKRSYQKGIVIIQCPSCKERHLIADNLGWFTESMQDGKITNVEDLLKAKGEKIRKGKVGMDGTIEYEGEGDETK